MGTIIALAALGLGITFFFVAGSFPHLAADPGGPALFPRIAALVTAAAAVGVVIQEAGRWWEAGRVGERRLSRVRHPKVLVFVAVAALPFAISYLGFVAGTFGFALFVLLGLGVRWIHAALASALTAGALYVAYVLILGAVLPAGQLLTY